MLTAAVNVATHIGLVSAGRHFIRGVFTCGNEVVDQRSLVIDITHGVSVTDVDLRAASNRSVLTISTAKHVLLDTFDILDVNQVDHRAGGDCVGRLVSDQVTSTIDIVNFEFAIDRFGGTTGLSHFPIKHVDGDLT